MSSKKKFGLVIPKKAETLKTQKNSIFDNESDDDENSKKRPKIPQKKTIRKNLIKTESDVDNSIYEYDSIYDEMKKKQTETIAPKEKKNSRYIETLLKAADKRKKEYERRIDRKIQVERENEGDQFKDKEEFVTSSYKKKLQEKEEEEERERRENMLNDMMDVTKQKDLSGFYRHFLNQTIGEEKMPIFGEKQIKQQTDSDQDNSLNKMKENIKTDENLDRDSDGIEIDSDDKNEHFSSDENKNRKTHRKRKTGYSSKRKKNMKSTSDNSEPENTRSPKPVETHISRSSENSDSDVSNNEGIETTGKSLYSGDKSKKMDENDVIPKSNSRHDSVSSDDEIKNRGVDSNKAVVNTEFDAPKGEKQTTIYAKRTVGEIFAEAQARYFQRMAMRNSGT